MYLLMVNKMIEKHYLIITICTYNTFISLDSLGSLNIQLQLLLLNELSEIREERTTDEHFRF